MGFYKSTCAKHAVNRTFFGKTRPDLVAKSEAHLQRFQKLVKSCRIVRLDQCCIKDQLRVEMARYASQESIDQLMKLYDTENKSYFSDKYSPLNYQQAILSPLIDCYHRIAMVKPDGEHYMRQYDISSAYIAKLKDNNLLYPLGQPRALYGTAAMDFVMQSYNRPQFYVAKCLVLADKGILDDPFVPMLIRSRQKKPFENSSIVASVNATCRSCAYLFLKKNRTKNIKQCSHSPSQRSFSAVLLQSDIHYALEMGYAIRILHVDVFPNAGPIPSLQGLAHVYEQMRKKKKTTNVFWQKFLKQLVLSGFGKFAQKQSKPRSIKNLSSLPAVYNELGNIKRIHHLDPSTITVATEYKSTFRNSCNPLVFAISANSTRRMLHKTMRQCNQQGLLVSRLNCDSIIVCCPNSRKPGLEKMLEMVDKDRRWQLEEDCIVGHINNKKRSSITYTSSGTIVKICGLNLNQRHLMRVPDLDTSIVETNNFHLGKTLFFILLFNTFISMIH